MASTSAAAVNIFIHHEWHVPQVPQWHDASGPCIALDRQEHIGTVVCWHVQYTAVLSDILTATDSADIAALCLLDLSAAFDAVDHSILLRRLQRSYGLNGSALAWFDHI